MGREKTYAVADVGTTKISCLIATRNRKDEVEVVGTGVMPVADLFRKGLLVNQEKASSAITKAVTLAEDEAGCKVTGLTVGFSGEHFKSFNSVGAVPIPKTSPHVTDADVAHVVEAAQAVSLPPEREFLHVMPQEFFIDQGEGMRSPVGNSGVRLEVQVHIATTSTAATQAIYKAVRLAGYEISAMVLNPIVIGSALLTPEEEDLGTAVIDIGGGATDVAVFHKGAIRHTASVGVGGRLVTNDVTVGLQVPTNLAESLKLSHGHAFSAAIDPEEMVDIPAIGGRQAAKVTRMFLASVIEARVEEILTLAKATIDRTGLTGQLSCGVVLTGGGAKLTGIEELARKIFNLPVRVGAPGNDQLPESVYGRPELSTVVGLLTYSLMHPLDEGEKRTLVARMFGKVQDVVSSIFGI